MGAIAEESRSALLEEYRTALHDWSLARTVHASNLEAEEVLEATKRVEEIERKLRSHRSTQIVKYEAPPEEDSQRS